MMRVLGHPRVTALALYLKSKITRKFTVRLRVSATKTVTLTALKVPKILRYGWLCLQFQVYCKNAAFMSDHDISGGGTGLTHTMSTF